MNECRPEPEKREAFPTGQILMDPAEWLRVYKAGEERGAFKIWSPAGDEAALASFDDKHNPFEIYGDRADDLVDRHTHDGVQVYTDDLVDRHKEGHGFEDAVSQLSKASPELIALWARIENKSQSS